MMGLAAVSGACVLSGLSGVWLERIVQRNADVPIWLRNIQLGILSLVIGLGSVVALDGRAVLEGGFFQVVRVVVAVVY